MKRLLVAITIVFALWLPITATLTGCKTPTAQRQAFNTVYSLGATVDASYRAYLDLVVTGQVSTNGVRAVAQQYNAFQDAFRAAVVVVTLNTNAPAPASLIGKAAEVTATIENAKKAN